MQNTVTFSTKHNRFVKSKENYNVKCCNNYIKNLIISNIDILYILIGSIGEYNQISLRFDSNKTKSLYMELKFIALFCHISPLILGYFSIKSFDGGCGEETNCSNLKLVPRSTEFKNNFQKVPHSNQLML